MTEDLEKYFDGAKQIYKQEPIKLVPGKSDFDLAKEHKEHIIQASEMFVKALTAASKNGFKFNVQFGLNSITNEVSIMQLVLMKEF